MDPENPYIGRIVVLLTPLLAAISGAIVTWVGTIVPGANLDGTELTALFVVGAGAIAHVLFKWLDNRGKYEQAVALNVAASNVVPPPDDPGHPPA